jgi:hypothetical protein
MVTVSAETISAFRHAYDAASDDSRSEYRATREGLTVVGQLLIQQQSKEMLAEIEKLKEALAFYRDNWTASEGKPSKDLLDDRGRLAKTILGWGAI